MSEQIVGIKKVPIIRIGKRERKILQYLKSSWKGERLKDIIESCENVRLNHLSIKQRKRLEAYYISSLNSLVKKNLVWKQKERVKTKLWLWPEESLDFAPQWFSTISQIVTRYGLI